MTLHLACWVVLLVWLCLVSCLQGLVVGVHLLAMFQGECIAWCKVFERCLLSSVAFGHYSSEMCFSAAEVHNDVLLKFISSIQQVQLMQLVHISVLDDWCNMYSFHKNILCFSLFDNIFPAQILQSCEVWFVLDSVSLSFVQIFLLFWNTQDHAKLDFRLRNQIILEIIFVATEWERWTTFTRTTGGKANFNFGQQQ